MKVKKTRRYFNIVVLVLMAVVTVVRYAHYMKLWMLYECPWLFGFVDSMWLLIPLCIGNLVFYFLLKRKS